MSLISLPHLITICLIAFLAPDVGMWSTQFTLIAYNVLRKHNLFFVLSTMSCFVKLLGVFMLTRDMGDN